MGNIAPYYLGTPRSPKIRLKYRQRHLSPAHRAKDKLTVFQFIEGTPLLKTTVAHMLGNIKLLFGMQLFSDLGRPFLPPVVMEVDGLGIIIQPTFIKITGQGHGYEVQMVVAQGFFFLFTILQVFYIGKAVDLVAFFRQTGRPRPAD